MRVRHGSGTAGTCEEVKTQARHHRQRVAKAPKMLRMLASKDDGRGESGRDEPRRRDIPAGTDSQQAWDYRMTVLRNGVL